MLSLQVPYPVHLVASKIRTKRHHKRAEVVELHRTKKDSLTMKAMFFGMMFSMSLGPLILMEVDQDKQFARDFSYSLVGGSLGAGICFCAFLMDNFRSMARHSMGNLLIAAAFGPGLTYWIADRVGMKVTPGFICAVSASLGTGGVFLLKIAGPAFLAIVPALIRKWAGVSEPDPQPPPS